MRALHRAAAVGTGELVNRSTPEQVQTDRGAHDVGDAVEGADLVEVDPLPGASREPPIRRTATLRKMDAASSRCAGLEGALREGWPPHRVGSGSPPGRRPRIVALVAANPHRFTPLDVEFDGQAERIRARARIASAGTPASMTAPRTMSPADPLKTVEMSHAHGASPCELGVAVFYWLGTGSFGTLVSGLRDPLPVVLWAGEFLRRSSSARIGWYWCGAKASAPRIRECVGLAERTRAASRRGKRLLYLNLFCPSSVRHPATPRLRPVGTVHTVVRERAPRSVRGRPETVGPRV